jgi:hypothetical protein
MGRVLIIDTPDKLIVLLFIEYLVIYWVPAIILCKLVNEIVLGILILIESVVSSIVFIEKLMVAVANYETT